MSGFRKTEYIGDKPEAVGRAQTPGDALSLPAPDVEQWIRDNRSLAMLGSFAIGVFLGVLLRR